MPIVSRRQAWGKDQDRHLFAGVVGAAPGRIVAVVGGEDQEIVGPQLGDQLGQAAIERLKRLRHSRARRGDGRIPGRNRRNWS